MRRIYIHERADWPRLYWKPDALADALAGVRHRQGRLLGRMENLGFDLRREAVLGTLVEDAVKSSDIEGEQLDAAEFRSSVARRLGMDAGGVAPVDRDVEGVVELMLDATGRYDQPLTAERLFDWHASLFPTGRSGMRRIAVGRWREEQADPMQVVSGPIGRSGCISRRRRRRMSSQIRAERGNYYIMALVAHGLLARNPGGGRNTSYRLVTDSQRAGD